MAIDYEIRHCIPGRIRVHLPAIGRVAGFGAAVERLLPQFDGVQSVRVNRACCSVVVEFDPWRGDVAQTLQSSLADLTPAEVVGLASSVEGAAGDSPEVVGPRDSGTLAIACAAAVLALVPATAPLAWLGIAWASAPIARRAFVAVIDEQRLNIDVLDILAIGFTALQGSPVTGAMLTGLVALGDTIRAFTAGESERAVAQLIEFQHTQAFVVRDGRVVLADARALRRGDTVVVYAGGTIPVDGVVTRGRGSVDQQTISGESTAVDRTVGETVFAGTTIVDGELFICAERVGAETAAAQMVSLVEQAPRTDTRIQNYAERYADQLVAPSLAAAGGLYAISRDVNRLTSMLLVDIGTGIRIAAPTSVLATMARAARQGILVKGGRPLEQLSAVDTIVFDKTGTLTTGCPEVAAVHACDPTASSDEVLALAAAAELRCPHPVARAVVQAASERGLTVLDRSDSHYRLGLGVEARVCGSLVHAGSERFLQRRSVDLQHARRLIDEAHDRGLSSLLVARDGRLIGTVEYRDRIRPESRAVVRTLRNRRLRCIMLTGDNQRIATAVARELGLDEVYSGVLPSQKADIVRRLQAQGRSAAMIGDGMNDTAALAHADVGIAMHGGADVARASADVVLIDGSLWNVVTAIDLAERAVGLIHQNWQITAAANALAFALAIPAGTVSPLVTALLSNGSAILAGVNAARPLWG